MNIIPKVIIIGGDHHNTLGLVRAFGKEGYHIVLFVVAANNKSFVAHSKYVNDCYVVDNENKVIDILVSKVKENNVRIPIITASDQSAELLDKHYNELSKHFIIANCGGEQGGISKWMNKVRMLDEAKKCGLMQPFSMFVNSKVDFNIDKQEIPFPCVVKPSMSSHASKDDFRICKDISNLRDVLNDMSKRDIPVIVQEFIKVDYEFLIIGARCRNTGKNHIVGGLHKHKCCKDINNMGMFVTAETTPDIPNGIELSKVNTFLESIDYEGLYSLEFMISGDKAYFTEINLRNDGCLFCWTNAGCNIAVNWMNEISKGIVQIYNKLQKRNMLVEISYLKYYRQNMIDMLRDFHKADAFAIFDKHDIKPFLYKFINAI